MPQATDLYNAEAVTEIFDRAAGALRGSPRRSGSVVRLPASGRLLVTGDLHDNPVHLEKIMRLARLEASSEHHVVLHELIHGERLINGMDFSHRVLARVAGLVVGRPGQVHPLLGNHELAQMTGRAVSKGAGNSVEQFNDALEFVYGDAAATVSGAIGRFIRAMPIALKSESGLLCAHSLPGAAAMGRFDCGLLERDLQEEDYRSGEGSAHLMVWGRRHTPEQIETLADRWQVTLFCLGHQHAETGIEIKGPRVVVLNSDHELARVLPVDLAALPSPEEALGSAIALAAVGGEGGK